LQEPSQREDFWDPLKYISLGREGWYLTLARTVRPFYEFYHHHNWGAGAEVQMAIPAANHGKHGLSSWQPHPCFRGIAKRRRIRRNGGPQPSQDKNVLDVNQAFIGLTVIRGGDKPMLELKLGRQELNYGESSVVPIRELNVRRTFDGLKAIVRAGDWRIGLLAFRPALPKPGVFDDGIDSS